MTQEFNEFQSKSCAAYNVLRGELNHFITLFQVSDPLLDLGSAEGPQYIAHGAHTVRACAVPLYLGQCR
jgi:hypothetical protein